MTREFEPLVELTLHPQQSGECK